MDAAAEPEKDARLDLLICKRRRAPLMIHHLKAVFIKPALCAMTPVSSRREKCRLSFSQAADDMD